MPGNDEPAAVWVAPSELRPWEKNPRKNDRAVDKVAASIQTFGFGAPIVARLANREIIGGHTRWKAAQKLGLERVPVRFLDVDEATAHALAIADNRTGEIAAWDDAMLAVVLADLQKDGVDLATTGYAEHELRKILADASGEADVQREAVETAPQKLQAKWQTERGQTWEIPSASGKGVHRIRCGSSTDEADVAAVMGDERADMMWTDPPYGVDVVGGSRAMTSAERRKAGGKTISNDALRPDKLRELLAACFTLASTALAAGAAWYVAYPDAHFRTFLAAFDVVGWAVRQPLVWVKDAFVLGRSDYHSRHEGIYFGYTPGKGRRGRGGPGWYGSNAEGSVFEVPKPRTNDLHPTMKPVELVARMVQNSAPPGGLVYEPFSGSGSTMLACERTGRLCRAIELDPKYVAVALERMAEVGCHGQLRAA